MEVPLGVEDGLGDAAGMEWARRYRPLINDYRRLEARPPQVNLLSTRQAHPARQHRN
jgi:hypothetical protein